MPWQSERQRRYCYYLKSKGKTPDWCKRMMKDENPCWSGYTQKGFKLKNKKLVPNCVKTKK